MTIRDYTTKISNFNWHQLLSQETPYEIAKTVFNRVSIYAKHVSHTFLVFLGEETSDNVRILCESRP